MWFWLSLIAILFWSGSDLFSKMGSEPDDKLSHWKMVMAVGGIMGLHAGFELLRGASFQLSDMITYLPASALYILSMILGYVGLRYIVLSVSTPVCNSSGAVACLLCYFILKETLSGLQIVGIALIVIGVVGLAAYERRAETLELAGQGGADRKYTHSLIAISFPILYCIIDALGTFVDAVLLDGLDGNGGYIAEESANIAYELTFLLMAVIAFVYVVLIRKERFQRKADLPKLTAGVCETAGQLAYIYAIGGNAVAAAPLISSYCIFSLVWARIILKEKLRPFQYLVILFAVCGIVILGIAEA